MAGAIQLIDALVKQSTAIDSEFIERASKIEVKSGDFPSKAKTRKVKIGKPRSWLLSLRNDVKYPGNENRVEADNAQIEITDNEEPAWFWMEKGSRFYEQAKAGDLFVIIEREKLIDKEPKSAYRHFVIKNH